MFLPPQRLTPNANAALLEDQRTLGLDLFEIELLGRSADRDRREGLGLRQERMIRAVSQQRAVGRRILVFELIHQVSCSGDAGPVRAVVDVENGGSVKEHRI